MGGSDKVPITVRHVMLPHSFSHSITSDTMIQELRSQDFSYGLNSVRACYL